MGKRNSIKGSKSKSIESNDAFQGLFSQKIAHQNATGDRLIPYYRIIQSNKLRLSKNEDPKLNFPILCLPNPIRPPKKIQRPDSREDRTCLTPNPAIKVRKKSRNISECYNLPLSSVNAFDYNVQNLGLNSFSSSRNEATDYKFSLVSRISINPQEKDHEEIPEIFKNINLTPSKTLEKKLKLEKDKKIKDFKESVHKLTKLYIYQLEKEKKTLKYQEKFNRFEWRLKGDQIIKLKTSWLLLGISIGFTTLMKHKFNKRVQFKKHAYLNFCIIVIICRFLGKLKRALFRYRYKILVFRLKKNAYKIHSWVNQIKHYHMFLICNIVDNFSMASYMQQFMIQFIRTVVVAQNGCRGILAIKKVRYQTIMLCLRKNQQKLQEKNKTFGFKKHPQARHFFIDADAAFYYKQSAKMYVKDMKNYKERIMRYDANLDAYLMQNDTIEGFTEIQPIKPTLQIYSNLPSYLLTFNTGKARKSILQSKAVIDPKNQKYNFL
ncbi:hypothetical protein SteCoe_34423 [Stentor coeruleus]|uniref:Uncharacterized protein n=1 Tax=Stentor coeruleus TaxID=5963 RepID=A0A1R2AUS3_9CILI|nr:hypothetical protein SteCoe_34423 [Stentor coeruleus]